MVGVPKSRGCSTCKTRSIKCDEARPSCSQCRRGGRKCPGYQNHLKFVDESAKLQGKAGGKASPSTTNAATESSAESVNTFSHQSLFIARHNPVAPETSKSNSGISQDSSLCSNVGYLDVLKLHGFRPSIRSLERDGVVSSFVQDLFPLGRSTVQSSFIGSWLWHVPEVLHKNNAMDLAAESLALAYFAKKAKSTETLIRSHYAYAGALRNLSNVLQDQLSRFASETLCATLLLVHFETFVATRGISWITHAGGAGRLIQLRGPNRHRSGFDSAMFMASRGYMISQAVATGNRCFLDNEEWRCIQIDDNGFPLMPGNSAIYHEGLNHFASIPGVIEKFRRLSNGSLSVHHAGLYSEVKRVRSNMMEWFEKLQSDLKLPIRILLPLPLSPHMTFPSVYEYRDNITATFVVNYYTYLLQENIALSEEICMSAAYCSKAGFCGMQALAYALPLALSALPQRYNDGIKHQINILETVQETFALRSTDLDENGTV